jgi:uncharacterized DUF497 family protein
MNDDSFEWDGQKAALNYARHSVSFEAARGVFEDPFAVEWLDERNRHNEERFCIIGMVEGHLLFVAFTMRGEKVRLISARRAEPFERRKYHEENEI